MAEWLRRSTRNRLGLSRVGSSPASVDFFFAGGGTMQCAAEHDGFVMSHNIQLLFCFIFVRKENLCLCACYLVKNASLVEQSVTYRFFFFGHKTWHFVIAKK